ERADRLVVRLNRGAKRNAIDQEMVDELHRVCADLESRPRLALFTGGDDGIFAAGADIAQLRDRTSLDALRAINSALFRRIRAL
ncbi:enoyl-CoA hydratase/isomerase family protein, partial [Streptococcus pyogenes]